MKKQTAVEWLEEILYNKEDFNLSEIFEQAKEMEKQQIINCYNQSWHFRDKPYETAEKYYNKTFGK
jgi:hypothetical protein